MLRRSLDCGGVWNLDRFRQHLYVHSYKNILGAVYAGCGLYGPQDHLVHERRCEHRPRHRHPLVANAIDPDPSGISGPEARLGDHVRTGGHVSHVQLATLSIS
jgi:hypothetical protein